MSVELGPLALWLLCGSIALPVTVLAIECMIGSFMPLSEMGEGAAPPFTVLMPAHNEANGIRRCILSVVGQLRACDELIVVADNCTDDTALIATRAGATVITRIDHANSGKGYALEFGRDFVATHPREIVIVVDADCSPDPRALCRIAATAWRNDAVVQGAYLLEPPAGARPNVHVSCFAFLVKNLVRQRALQHLAGAALLQGSGMAFPSRIFHSLRCDTASLIEDLELGVRLLENGQRVLFEERARFTSPASSERGTAGQRRRWEHGFLRSMPGFAARLALAALKGRWRLFFAALDALVPPTVLLILTAALAGALTSALFGLQPAVVLLLCSCLLLTLGLGVAWRAHGRDLLPAELFPQVFRYVIWKLPIIARFVVYRERRWIRTERDP